MTAITSTLTPAVIPQLLLQQYRKYRIAPKFPPDLWNHLFWNSTNYAQ